MINLVAKVFILAVSFEVTMELIYFTTIGVSDFEVIAGYLNCVIQPPFLVFKLKQVNFLLILHLIIISFAFFVYWLHDEQNVFFIKVLPFKFLNL